MFVQCGSIISANVYVESDSPLYRSGNLVLVAVNFLAIGLFILTKIYYVWRNKQREKAWNALTEDERTAYTVNTKLKGSRRLDFRFAH